MKGNLTIYGVFHLSEIQCYSMFFRENEVFLDLERKSSPKKIPGMYIPLDSNFKYIKNIKLSFAKNDIANFDYALTFKKTWVWAFNYMVLNHLQQPKTIYKGLYN